MSLAFLPPAKVEPLAKEVFKLVHEGLPEVRQIRDGLAGFEKYFMKTWFRLYPVGEWNLYQQSLTTNNRLEGWNNWFNSKVGKHPRLDDFVEFIKEEEAIRVLTYEQVMENNTPVRQRQKYRQRQKEIDALNEKTGDLSSKSVQDILEYLQQLTKLNHFNYEPIDVDEDGPWYREVSPAIFLSGS